MTTLDKSVDNFERVLSEMTRTFDTMITRYQSLIQQQQFEVNKLTSAEDISNNGVVDLSKRVAQQTVITALLLIVPTATTSATIQMGRFSFIIDNPNVITMLYPLQYIIGSADTVKATYNPIGNHPGYFAIFGYKTGSNNQL